LEPPYFALLRSSRAARLTTPPRSSSSCDGHEAETSKAEQHQRPCRGLWYAIGQIQHIKILVFVASPKTDARGPTSIPEIEGDIAVERIAASGCQITAIGRKNK
jgi:hypothetical protein